MLFCNFLLTFVKIGVIIVEKLLTRSLCVECKVCWLSAFFNLIGIFRHRYIINVFLQRGECKMGRKVNFFEIISDEDEKRQQRKAKAKVRMIKILIASMLVAGSVAVKGYEIYLKIQNNKIDEKIAGIEESYSQIKGTIEAMNYITMYKTTLSSQIEFLDGQNDFSLDFISKLDNSKISQATVKNISYSKDVKTGASRVEMNCTVISAEYAPAYISKLEQAGLFKEVQYSGAQAQGQLYAFKVTGIIKEGVKVDKDSKSKSKSK